MKCLLLPLIAALALPNIANALPNQGSTYSVHCPDVPKRKLYSAPPPKTSEEIACASMYLATLRYKTGYYKGAVNNLTNVIKMYPNHPDVQTGYLNFWRGWLKHDYLDDQEGGCSDFMKGASRGHEQASRRWKASCQMNSYKGTQVKCKNSHLLVMNTMLGRKGFFGWLNDDFSESINAYDEYIKCFAKTNEEKTFALTLRGLSKQSMGNVRGACYDWNLVSELGDWEKGEISPDPYPYYWSIFKKEYKKERKLKEHKDAFETVEKKLRLYDRESGKDLGYMLKTCREFWEIRR